jgi:hypothetical protein
MTYTFRLIIIRTAIVLLAFFPRDCFSSEPKADVRIHLDAGKPYWVGQKVSFYVELLSPTFFSGIPRFDLPDIPGTVVMKIEERPVLGSQQIGENSFTTQQHEFAIFPQRQGKIMIPSFPVRFSIAGAIGEKPVEHRITTDETDFTAAMPPGAEEISTVITTRNLSITEKWEPSPKEAKEGDAFTRTVILKAPDIPGMAFPPLPQMNIPTIGIYPKPPVVKDRMERGDFIGERTYKVTYVCETEGSVTIPAITIHWWDIEAETLKTEVLPEITLDVAPGTTDKSMGEPGKTKSASSKWVIILILFILSCITFYIFSRFGKSVTAYIKRVRTDRAETESAFFNRLLAACKRNDPLKTCNELMRWIDRVSGNRKTATLSDFLKQNADTQLKEELGSLQNAALNPEAPWRGNVLASRLKTYRKQSKKSFDFEKPPILSELNP